MARVRRVHALKQYFTPLLVKVYGLTALSIVLFSSISVAHVIKNMPSLLAPKNVLGFFIQAVLNTDMFVQVVLSTLCILFILGIRDMFKTMKGVSFLFTKIRA